MKEHMDMTARHLAHLEDRNEQVQIIRDTYPHPELSHKQEEDILDAHESQQAWLASRWLA
jgi:hypothetical protein